MASGTTRPGGDQWVFFTYAGKRHTLRLGPIGQRARQEIEGRVERLIATKAAGLPQDSDIRTWLAALGKRPHGLLSRLGLAQERVDHTVTGLFTWHRKHLHGRGRKDKTLAVFDRVEANCLSAWGGARRIAEITNADADNLERWLLAKGNRGKKPLATTTTSRRLAMAKQVFKAAVERGWVASNPFAHIKRRGEVNTDRDEYVPWQTIERLLDVETTAEFRLLLVLARVCGVRCPSEVQPLLWSSIDRDLGLIVVESPKTEIHDRPRRDIPLFRTVEPYVQEAFDAYPTLPLKLFPSFQGSATAITNRLARVCRKAKVLLWAKPWNNLRASALTDMCKAYPIHEAATYLGHKPETALRHYNRVAKELRARAEGQVFSPPDLTWEPKRAHNQAVLSEAL